MADVLSNLKKPAGATTAAVRIGRGVGSGLGKTAGRGQKGQYARTRGGKPHFEGGQTPIHRRIPKRGFKVRDPRTVACLNVADLARFEAGTMVDETTLREHGLVSGEIDSLKILGTGVLSVALKVSAHAFSKSAAAKIEAAGGTVVLISRRSTL